MRHNEMVSWSTGADDEFVEEYTKRARHLAETFDNIIIIQKAHDITSLPLKLRCLKSRANNS